MGCARPTQRSRQRVRRAAGLPHAGHGAGAEVRRDDGSAEAVPWGLHGNHQGAPHGQLLHGTCCCCLCYCCPCYCCSAVLFLLLLLFLSLLLPCTMTGVCSLCVAQVAVDGVDLTLTEGSITVLLGHNGAGV
jgi:hypothetical protein